MEKFELEKMAIEYCAQYGIADDSTHKADIINAFCVGAKIEREACAMVAENFDFNDRQEIEPPRNLPRYVATAIRKRSNDLAKPPGAALCDRSA